jgi:hypothetical protein
MVDLKVRMNFEVLIALGLEVNVSLTLLSLHKRV